MITVGKKLGFDNESLEVTTESILGKMAGDTEAETRRSGRINKGKIARRFEGWSLSSDEF